MLNNMNKYISCLVYASIMFSCFTLLLDVVIAEETEVIELHGSGTTNPSKYFWRIMDYIEEQAKLPLFMTYRAVGSGTGMAEFVGQASNDYQPYNHFGSGDIPITSDLYQALAEANRTMVHVPFALGAISFFHSVPVKEQPENGIQLSPCLLSKIFQRKIKYWDHPDILAENDGLSFNGKSPEIKVVHRTVGSSSTAASTEYMKSANLNAVDTSCLWDLSTGNLLEDWPVDTTAAVGSGGVAAFIENTPYAIGYLDSGHGQAISTISEVALKNDHGYLRSTDANISDALTAAVLPTNPTDNWADVQLYSQPGVATWPITTMSYFYIDQNLTALGSTGTLLKAFVQHVMSEAGQALVEEFGFERLPPSIVDGYITDTINSLVTHSDAAPWSFEEKDEVPQKFVGAGKYVLSGKRQSYAEYERDQMSGQIQDLQASVLALDARAPHELHGSGTTNPSKFFWRLMDLMEERAKLPLFMTYRAVGSSTGMKEAVGDESSGYMPYNHFGSGDIPVTQELHSSLASPMVHVPFALGAIAIFHSLPASDSPVQMSACLLSKVFQRRVTTWDHADVLAENPGLSVPEGMNISVVHRSLGSSSTAGLTEYLDKATQSLASDCRWDLETGSQLSDWPQDTFVGVGSDGVAAFIRDNAYAIGYLDAGHGMDLGFQEVALQNDEQYLVSSAADIGAAATEALKASVLPADPSESWHMVNLYSQPGSLSWPITTMSYFYIRKDLKDLGSSGTLLKAFVSHVLSTEGQDLVEEFGFNRLSAEILEYNARTLESVAVDSTAANWEFEEGSDVPDVYQGAGKYVLSGKRRTYTDYKTDLIQDNLSQLEALVTQLQAKITTLESAVPVSSDDDDHDDDDHEDIVGVAIAALILALLALLLSLFNTYKAHASGGGLGSGCAAPQGQPNHVKMSNDVTV
mmetsp:Transcript_21296/g.29548  ORF Transcript_21296/g.29548 Transcript_21296/m.29548 type:complete len:920 (+) Transcript_21296:49-2808(+)